MVKYSYDAWGNCKVLNASGAEITAANHIGNLNPFRYRGYYYDTETKLYYLQSRYYDPEIGRFITIDDISYLDPDAINGLNLYAYCLNNPVMYIDTEGTFAITTAIIIGLITGAAIGGTVGGVYAYNQALSAGITGWDLFGQTLLGVIGGALIGGAIGGLMGAVFPFMGSFLSSTFSITIPQLLGDVIGYTVVTVTGAQLVATGAVAAGIGISMFAKQSKRSGKEMSSDKPSWVNSNMVDHNKSAQQNATDILNEKYGVGNWESGPKSEYNKIVKWIIRKIFFGG